MEHATDTGFLYGVDFSFHQDCSPCIIAQYPPAHPGPVPPLNNVLKGIPAQRADTVRVLVEHFPDGSTLINLFQSPSYTWLVSNYTSTSLAEIIAQCQGEFENGTSWGFSMTSFDHSAVSPDLGPDLTTKWWLPRARFFRDPYSNIICRFTLVTQSQI